MSNPNYPGDPVQEVEKLKKQIKLVSIQELIPEIRDPQNIPPLPKEAEEIDEIEDQEKNFGRPQFTQYADNVYTALVRSSEEYNLNSQERYKEIKDAFKRFKGQIVIDLGAGARAYGYPVAAASKAKGYIAVEPYFPGWLKESLERMGQGYSNFEILPSSENIPASIVPEDILSFLKRLPDNSVSIFSSGIMDNILSDEDYIKQVQNEIKRVLHPQGAFISHRSYDLEKDLERPDSGYKIQEYYGYSQWAKPPYTSKSEKEITLIEFTK